MIKEIGIAARAFNNALPGDLLVYRNPQPGIGRKEAYDYLWLRVVIPDGEANESFTEKDLVARRRYNIPFDRLRSLMPGFDPSKIRSSGRGAVPYQPFMDLDTGTLMWRGSLSILPSLREIIVDTGYRRPERDRASSATPATWNEKVTGVPSRLAYGGLTLCAARSASWNEKLARDVLKLTRRQFAKFTGVGLATWLLLRAQEVQAATSRRSGLNESVDTYGAAGQGRDYTSIGTWEAATDNNNVAAAVSPVLECYADSASFNDFIHLSGAINDANYFRIIRPAAGQQHNGTPNTGFFTLATTADDGCNIVEGFSQIQDVIIKVTVNVDAQIYGIILQGANAKAIGCIVYDSSNAFTGRALRGIGLNADNTAVISCLVNNCEEYGILNLQQGNLIYNCTVVDISTQTGSRGIHFFTGGTGVVKNCLVQGTNTADYGSAGSSTGSSHNASQDATGADLGATGSRINQPFTFVNAAGKDFHLDPTDTGARGFGTSLAADASFSFDDDIDRTLIQTWSMGFDSVNAAGISGSIFKRYYDMMMQQFILIFCFLLCASPVFATTRYIATTGDDTNNTCAESTNISTPKRNFKGTNGAIACMTSGDTLIVRGGTYTESDIGASSPMLPSGISDSQRTIVRAHTGETPVLRPTSGNGPWAIYSRSFITVDGLVFDADAVGGYTAYNGRANEADTPAANITYQNCTFRNGNLSGMSIGQRQNTVTSNCNMKLLNSTIHGNGQSGAGHGVYSSCRGNLIEGNEFYSNADHGIHVYSHGVEDGGDAWSGTSGTIVRNNTVHNNGKTGIGLYNGVNVQAYNNLVYNNGTDRGIAIRYGCVDCKAYNNTVYSNDGTAGIYIDSTNTTHPVTGAMIRNNIIHSNAGTNLINSVTNTIISNNLCQTGCAVNESNAANIFIDPINLNLQLKSSSPAINQGTTIPTIPTDFLGVSRPQGSAYDIGAYEFAVTTPEPSIITMTYPVSGTEYRWKVGTQETITWTSANVIGGLDIWMSQNAGLFYTKIAQNIPNSGSYTLTIQPPGSIGLARLKLTAANDVQIADQSTLLTIQGEYLK